tara:strand:- start:1544 stop:1966 length:423 start_codon:yes stop_codon:yes gene_type:complete
MIILLLLLVAAPAAAVPVVPNFSSGSMTATTTTKTKVTEVINQYDYNTGYELSVTGTNIKAIGGEIAPRALTTTINTINGVSSKWTGLDPSDKPVWHIVNPGEALQYTETLQGPGLTTHTIIDRTTDIESKTETTSIFTQ